MKANTRWPYEFGFEDPFDVRDRYSVAELFPKSKGRTGIYLLEFDNGLFYIGQTNNIVSRFAAHQHDHQNIVRLRFQRLSKSKLNAREQELIRAAGRRKIRITNIVHAATVEGETDLDSLLPPEDQQRWLEDPADLNLIDIRRQVGDDDIRRLRTRDRFLRQQANQHYEPLLALAQRYVQLAIPAPGLTEVSFWGISCLPETKDKYWQRMIVVNVHKMETLVISFFLEVIRNGYLGSSI